MGPGVGDVEGTRAIERQAGGVGEMAGGADAVHRRSDARGAGQGRDLAGGDHELANGAVVLVRDVERALAVPGEAYRAVEPGRAAGAIRGA